MADLKRIIKMHAIKDRPITVDDIILAKEIFGPDVASLKGNTVQQTPMPVVCLFYWDFKGTIGTDFVQARKVAEYHAVLSRIIILYAKLD